MSLLARLISPQTRNLENPKTPLRALAAELGFRTKSGQKVDRDLALTYAAVWRAVNLISRDLGKVPLEVLKRLPEGGKERATSHPAFPLLRWKPNEHTSAFVFRETLQGHALLTGNGYAVIERDGAGRTRSLLQVDPARMTPVRKDGILWYIYESEAETFRLRPEDVIHIRGYSFDGLVGLSVIRKAAESMGLGLSARDFGATYFRNSATPKTVLEHPMLLDEETADRLRGNWERMHASVENAHRTAILEEGMKAKVLSFNHKDSQLLETRQFEIREIASWFGVPPHKLGDDAKTSFASLEQENQAYLDEAVDPWLVKWEMELRDKVLTERQKSADSHVVEFNRRALIRVDAKGRASMYASGLQNGWMNRDEARNAENLPPIPDGEGKKFFAPLNLQILGEAAPAPAPPGQASEHPNDDEEEPRPRPPEEEEEEDEMAAKVRQTARGILEDATGRIARRLALAAARAAKRPEAWFDFLDSLADDHRQVILETLERPLGLAGLVEGREAPQAEELAGRILGHVREALLSLAGECKIGELPAGVEAWAETAEADLTSTVQDWMDKP